MAGAGAPETMRKALAMGAASGDARDRRRARRVRHGLDGARPRGGAAGPRVRPRPGRRGHVRRRRGRRPGRGRDAARPAVPVVRREDRARPGRRHGPRPPDQPDRLRGPRGADAGPRRRDAGARRAALPVAEGDHGRPLEDDRDEGPRRRRRGRRPTPRRSARVATTTVVGSEAPPPRAATRVIREPADEAARQVVAFLAERRII